ncbi:uncharacterized protein LOC124365628 [Homalodisca vitripennis]|uniref:uncharacterized protein LOC124365628 n=1 Tax=Homalodisca vitripennis TaxID=197043 RepID=UPI001EEA6835|nr:uncharacterized protein LOC124365628 [Homalodisca vitripennis]
MEDSRLIELVREHPCLFNAKHHLYKDANVRDNVWSEIGMKMKLPAEECKNRWKNIRDTYMRRKRAKKLPTGSASSKKVRKWHLEDYLEFMNVVKCERETVTNTITQDDETKVDGQETENVEMAEESVYSEIRDPEDLNKYLSEEPEQLDGDGVPKQSKKRKLKTKLSGESILKVLKRNSEERSKLMSAILDKPKEQHPIDVFFQSMAMTVKKFSLKIKSVRGWKFVKLLANWNWKK